jgi:hypothetical protein
MMVHLLTYHQVCPSYLNFMCCLVGASEPRFGGFRAWSRVSKPLLATDELGRSGCHYSLSFRLLYIKKTEDDIHTWLPHAVAVYHQFDVKAGTALWIITSTVEHGDEKKIWIWHHLRDSIHDESGAGFELISEEHHERFAGSTKVLLSIVAWSITDLAQRVHHLEGVFRDIVRLVS